MSLGEMMSLLKKKKDKNVKKGDKKFYVRRTMKINLNGKI